ncbi:DJ-1/PfpI family protein [Chelatococcus reniformis]|uniref:Transcriptional regulator n=1 Tax=Chelatococcus reniformis TaxID=1494448 RepID=A0A916USX4_9HYPH|nr:DJ-1/PfpI family protein [Chelatococcus reniformis]GGC86803.1 transcriptional regulator [Chelatococcus reniformis]
MRKRTILLAIGAALALPLIAAPFVLAPRPASTPLPPAAAVGSAEQARTIAAMRPPKRARPVIAIATFNAATEVSDLLSAYGVLRRADVADVTVVAERAAPVQLYPSLSIEPEATMSDFDARHPEGADYVVVPAMEPVDPFVAGWIAAQHRKGAKIVGICNGARTLAAAGLLDGRRATAHWNAIPELRQQHPTMQWVRDRRYVSDNGITTSTGISASVPVMLALVEAIGGRPVAERVAGDLGVTDWDARHRSAAFELTGEHQKTFVRNTLTFWRRETVGIPLHAGVDEVALGFMVDAYARTAMATVVTVGGEGAAVRSRHGLMIRPDRASDASAADHMLPAPSAESPAQTIARELPRIAARYDGSTAAIVALVMEYPWPGADVAAGAPGG